MDEQRPVPVAPSTAATVSRRRGWNRSRSTPSGTRCTLRRRCGRTRHGRTPSCTRRRVGRRRARVGGVGRSAGPGSRHRLCRSRSSRSWEIMTATAPRRRAHGPAPRGVRRSDTSSASDAGHRRRRRPGGDRRSDSRLSTGSTVRRRSPDARPTAASPHPGGDRVRRGDLMPRVGRIRDRVGRRRYTSHQTAARRSLRPARCARPRVVGPPRGGCPRVTRTATAPQRCPSRTVMSRRPHPGRSFVTPAKRQFRARVANLG